MDTQDETHTKKSLTLLCKVFSSRKRIPLNQQHDMALESIGYVENFKVIKSDLNDTVWNLIADVYFHDVDIDEALKGFSYSITQDIKGDLNNKLASVYLPFPLYNDEALINDLLGHSERLAIGAWRKKSATPDQIALIVSFGLFLISPAYNNFWINTISPLISKLLNTIGVGSVDYLLTAEGFKGEKFGIYFIPIRGKESECFQNFRLKQGLNLVYSFLENDELARNKTVYMVKLFCLETSYLYELKTVEYLDGTVVTNPKKSLTSNG